MFAGQFLSPFRTSVSLCFWPSTHIHTHSQTVFLHQHDQTQALVYKKQSFQERETQTYLIFNRGFFGESRVLIFLFLGSSLGCISVSQQNRCLQKMTNTIYTCREPSKGWITNIHEQTWPIKLSSTGLLNPLDSEIYSYKFWLPQLYILKMGACLRLT